jgi:hypothetical protein
VCGRCQCHPRLWLISSLRSWALQGLDSRSSIHLGISIDLRSHWRGPLKSVIFAQKTQRGKNCIQVWCHSGRSAKADGCNWDARQYRGQGFIRPKLPCLLPAGHSQRASASWRSPCGPGKRVHCEGRRGATCRRGDRRQLHAPVLFCSFQNLHS